MFMMRAPRVPPPGGVGCDPSPQPTTEALAGRRREKFGTKPVSSTTCTRVNILRNHFLCAVLPLSDSFGSGARYELLTNDATSVSGSPINGVLAHGQYIMIPKEVLADLQSSQTAVRATG